jgi:hypothetical protein
LQEELLQLLVRVGDGGGVAHQRADDRGQGEGKLRHGPVEFRNRLGDVCRGKGGIQAVEPALRGIGVKIGLADGGGGGSSGRGLLLLVARSHISFDYRLRVKSVTRVAEAYTTQPIKETASRVLYVYLACMAG